MPPQGGADQEGMSGPRVRHRLPVELVISDLGRRMAAQALAAVDGAGISEGAWWVLYELAHVSHGLSLVEVAHRTSLSPSTVTTVTDQLAARGWIERARAVDDRRRVVVVITEAGAAVLEDGLDRCETAFAADRHRLTADEWQQLQQLLTRLAVHRSELTVADVLA